MAGGASFLGKSEKALRINFCFVIATGPGAWHCTSDDVIDIHTRCRFFVTKPYLQRNLDK